MCSESAEMAIVQHICSFHVCARVYFLECVCACVFFGMRACVCIFWNACVRAWPSLTHIPPCPPQVFTEGECFAVVTIFFPTNVTDMMSTRQPMPVGQHSSSGRGGGRGEEVRGCVMVSGVSPTSPFNTNTAIQHKHHTSPL